MSKTDLVDYVAKQAGLTKKDALEAVEAVFRGIVSELKRAGSLTIPNFGTFAAKPVAARKQRNPRTGEMVDVAPHTKPSFKASATLKGALN